MTAFGQCHHEKDTNKNSWPAKKVFLIQMVLSALQDMEDLLDLQTPTYPLSRADSGGSVSSQERFRVGAFAGAGAGAELPSLEEELAQEPLLQLLPRPRPASTISLQSGEVSKGFLPSGMAFL